MEKISIIIPIYNMELYLRRALDSILHQTYTNWEALLIDDGSNDKSRQICEEYEKADKRFRYFYKENGGVSSARNFGLKMSCGNYITFLDPDDYLDPDMYKVLLEQLKENDADLAICGYRVVNKFESPISSNDYKVEILDRKKGQERYFEGSKRATEMAVLWNKLIPASYIKIMEFPVGRIQEDESITYKILYQASRIVYIDSPFYNYYIRESGYMNNGFNRTRFNLFEAYLERIAFYVKHQEFDLWKKMVLHYLHMFCQYCVWMEESEVDCEDLYIHYKKELKKIYLANKDEVKFLKKEKFECTLFSISPMLYYKAWKLLKKIRLKR